MAIDRVGELVGETKRDHRVLVSPEGVALDVQIARLGERAIAFLIDLVLMYGLMAVTYLIGVIFLSKKNVALVTSMVLFVAFIIRLIYFMHFELTTQGRTPGKKGCGLRVINRDGGELTPSAVIARNLTREIEFFFPLTIVLGLDRSQGLDWQLALLGWVLLVASLPLWNRDKLRMGDMIAGTLVIAIPKQALSYDLAWERTTANLARYSFTQRQLTIYGAFELQVLEELLRQPRSKESDQQLSAVRDKICRKIGWEEEVPEVMVRQFLTEFYAAERATLERGKLFGKLRADKESAVPDRSGR